MAVNGKESFGEKVSEFFTQNPADHAYEKMGGDARVPEQFRVGAKHEARIYAAVVGESDPYPEMGELDEQEVQLWRERYEKFGIKYGEAEPAVGKAHRVERLDDRAGTDAGSVRD